MRRASIVFAFVALSLGCPSGTSDNSNVNANRPVTKQFNGQPLDNSGKPIPGIPDPKLANVSNQAPGATPTPGIPEANKADISNKKGATPTPGIPDEATRKRMIEEIKRGSKDPVNTAPAVTPQSGKSPRGPLNRPRKSQN